MQSGTCTTNQAIPGNGDPPNVCFRDTWATTSSGNTNNYGAKTLVLIDDRASDGRKRYSVQYSGNSCAEGGGCVSMPLAQRGVATITPLCGVQQNNVCESDAGQSHMLGGAPMGNACFNGCAVKAKPGSLGVGVCFGSSCTASTGGNGEYIGTGQVCPEGGQTLSSNEKCETVGGRQVCTDPTKPNCIKVGGVESCFSTGGEICDTKECFDSGDEFIKRADGSEITKSSTGTPPAPDNGTPGQRAEPDMQFGVTQGENGDGVFGGDTSGGGTTGRYDYFSPGTAGNSTTNKGECDPDTQHCEDEPEEECEDDPATEEDECGSDRGDGAVKGKGGTAKSYQESFQAFYAKAKTAPIIAALGQIGQSMPAGACPQLSFQALTWGTISTTIHCDLAAQLNVLTALFLGIWALIAVRVFMSA